MKEEDGEKETGLCHTKAFRAKDVNARDGSLIIGQEGVEHISKYLIELS